jgi:Holliday junction DNA helicase RuvA
MISSVRGEVLSVHLDHAVIEVGGVGFAVRTTPATLAGLRRGEQARLSTSLVVREDSLTLFGFDSDAAKELFVLVQSVSGVGPKIALALLAVLDPDQLRRALGSGDTATLMRAPGIGKRGAERLVLELKDKVGTLPGPTAGPGPAAAGVGLPWRSKLTDALVGLGFTTKQADDATNAVAEDAADPAVVDGDVGVLLRRALALLGRHR